ncbi:ParA family protein [Endozoicomonas euniceicola]|uniref:AAA domain-containing protein n=1 Tax=Endozoicomonas euniceicola TaxID=1234143 RepID=A0ABY6GNY8_9GAMM|nr:hypothetical protein [Endozoicomonas euniceicola]UYM14457.1 hypothetical protein NX720_16350 [Endozoicomonas euniceicola]
MIKIVVNTPKGRVGKTTTATNIALLLVQKDIESLTDALTECGIDQLLATAHLPFTSSPDSPIFINDPTYRDCLENLLEEVGIGI